MNCVIVDDEVLAQKVLEKCVKKTNFLNLKGVYGNVNELISGLKSKEIDLIFLDVMLPEISGIEFLQSINDIPQVILVSSKKDFALEAFDYDVTDYLLKPIHYDRFLKAAMKAQNIHQSLQQSNEHNNEFFIKINQELVKISLTDVSYIEAYGDYVKVYAEHGNYVFLSTMKALEVKLPKTDFIRVHKSFIIRIDKIIKADSSTIYLSNKKQIPISRTYKDSFKDVLSAKQF